MIVKVNYKHNAKVQKNTFSKLQKHEIYMYIEK